VREQTVCVEQALASRKVLSLELRGELNRIAHNRLAIRLATNLRERLFVDADCTHFAIE
jgi:hypothetical protein